ncbi:MAG: hypothetical protein ACI85Q_002518 [Salibacteraceae bacterium]|jgi:uncharacterized protein YfiM (DUF2279 family)
MAQKITYPENWRTDSLSKKRVKTVAISSGAFYALTMGALYTSWYSQYNTGEFHTFDDNGEWEGVDKMGHALTAYQLSHYGREALWWSGMNNTQSTLYGAGYAMLYQTTIEVMDGYSEGWGFSWGDMAANTFGAGLYAAQQLTWREQRLSIKFSYRPTDYAQYRPNLLGSSWNERMLKDYNGQTYWLSGNVASFLKKDSKFPKWINVAGGYGGGGMLGGHRNPSEVDGVPVPYFERYKQFYFSLDVDFTRIPTRSKLLKTVFIALSFVKIPFPTLEFNTKGETIFHPIYF